MSDAGLREPSVLSVQTGSSELPATAISAALVDGVTVQQRAELGAVCP